MASGAATDIVYLAYSGRQVYDASFFPRRIGAQNIPHGSVYLADFVIYISLVY